MIVSDQTAKSVAREWWRNRIAEGDDINLAKEAHAAAMKMRESPEFCDAFLDEFLEPTMHDIGQRVMAIWRESLRTSSGLRRQITRDTTEEVRSRWQRWMEFDPENAIHMPLVNMNRQSLLNAAEYREEQAASSAHEARWLRLLAGKLNGDECVGDVLSDDDLDDLRSSMKSNVTKLRKAA